MIEENELGKINVYMKDDAPGVVTGFSGTPSIEVNLKDEKTEWINFWQGAASKFDLKYSYRFLKPDKGEPVYSIFSPGRVGYWQGDEINEIVDNMNKILEVYNSTVVKYKEKVDSVPLEKRNQLVKEVLKDISFN